MEQATRERGSKPSIMKRVFHFIGVRAKEYSYEIGLKSLISEISYQEGTNIHTIVQRILTIDYLNTPIVNLEIQKEKKALPELLITSSAKDKLFPEVMKIIEIEKTSIHVNDQYDSVFETHMILKDGSLMIEKYSQYYPISHYEDTSAYLLRLCGFGTRNLEIIYHESQPIYAQLFNRCNVEMAEFNPNSSRDANYIIRIINNEVDVIVSYLHSLIDE